MPKNYELLERFAEGDVEILEALANGNKMFLALLQQAVDRFQDETQSQEMLEKDILSKSPLHSYDMDCLFRMGLRHFVAHLKSTRGDDGYKIINKRWMLLDNRYEHDDINIRLTAAERYADKFNLPKHSDDRRETKFFYQLEADANIGNPTEINSELIWRAIKNFTAALYLSNPAYFDQLPVDQFDYDSCKQEVLAQGFSEQEAEKMAAFCARRLAVGGWLEQGVDLSALKNDGGPL